MSKNDFLKNIISSTNEVYKPEVIVTPKSDLNYSWLISIEETKLDKQKVISATKKLLS